MIKFTVPGEPTAQGRPRACRFGNSIRMFDPKKSTDFKSKVAFFFMQGNYALSMGNVRMDIKSYSSQPTQINIVKK